MVPRTRSLLALFSTAALGLVGCQPSQLGLPREALTVASPDGTRRAVVRNRPAIDPPAQALWLYAANQSPVHLLDLAEDQEWCDLAVWSPDSRRVAFLVQGVRVVVVEAGAVLLDDDLAPRSAYPPADEVRNLVFGEEGRTLLYRVCARGEERCGPSRRLDLPA